MWTIFMSLGVIVMLLVEFHYLRVAAAGRRDLESALDHSWQRRKELAKECEHLSEQLHLARIQARDRPRPEEIGGAISRILGRGLVVLGNDAGFVESLTLNGQPIDCKSLVLRLEVNKFPSTSIQSAGGAILEIEGLSVLATSDPDSIRNLLETAQKPASGTP